MSRKIAKIIIFSTLALLLAIPFLRVEPILAILLVISYYVAVFAFINHKIGLYLLILLRPCLDLLSKNPVFSLAGIPLNLSSILGLFVLVLTAFVLFKKRREIRHIPLKIPWLLFLGLTLASCFISVNFKSSATEWIRLLNLSALFLLGYLLTETAKDLTNIIRIIIYSTLIPTAFAFYQFFTKTGMSIPLEGIHNRIFGTFAHPNLLAFYLVIPIVLALMIFLLGNKREVVNIIATLMLVIMVIILILTYTRGAWLAFILAIMAITLFRFRWVFVGFIIFLLATYAVVAPIRHRVNDLVRLNPYGSIQWRIDLWRDSINYVKEKPALGFGTGTSHQVILEKRGEERGSPDPHNDYLKILLENGLAGILSYLLLIISLLATLYQRYIKTDKPNLKTLLLATICLSLSLYAMSFSDNIIRNTALQWIFWCLAGAVLAASKTTKQSTK